MIVAARNALGVAIDLPNSEELVDQPGALRQLSNAQYAYFVVTQDGDYSVVELLSDHLYAGLKHILVDLLHGQNFSRQNIWLPLLGTGSGGLEAPASLQLTLNAIENNETGFFDHRCELDLSLTPGIPAGELEMMLDYIRQFDSEHAWLTVDLSAFDPDTLLNTEAAFHHDGPANVDRLNFGPYVEALRVFLSNQEKTRTPISIAIDGPWGSGKSTFMLLLRKALNENILDEHRLDYTATTDSSHWFTSGLRLLWACLFVFDWWFALMRILERAPNFIEVFQGHWRAQAALDPASRFWLAFNIAEAQQDKVRASWRRFETAYVNVWRSQKADNIAAAIVHQLIQDLSVRKGPSFHVRLGLARLNRWRLIEMMFERLAGNIVTLVLMLAVLLFFGSDLIIAGMANNQAKMLADSGPVLGAGAIFAYGLLTRLNKASVQVRLSDFVQKPNYVDIVGPLSEVEQDFQRILRLLRSEGKTLVLFVDDLDRCSPDDTARIVEALNVFFAREGEENCIFILGLHRDLVATNLEIAYDKLVKQVDSKPLLAGQRPYGRRFLEKLAQLVVQIPRPDETALNNYIAGLNGQTAAHLQTAVTAKLTRERQLGGDRPDPVWEAAREQLQAQGVSDEQIDAAEAEVLAQHRRIEEAERIDENDTVFREVFAQISPYLHNSPRQYKRFFNVFRLNAYVDAARLNPRSVSERAAMLDIAKQTAISIEHPLLDRYLNDGEGHWQQCQDWARQAQAGTTLQQDPVLTLEDEVKKQIDRNRLLQDLLTL